MLDENNSQRDFIGSIDKSIVAFGLALIALAPTLFVTVFFPQKLFPMIESDAPKGRTNNLLSGGIFFLLSTSSFFLILSLFSNEAATGTGVIIGNFVNQAVTKGNMGGVLVSLAPVFILAISLAFLSWVSTRLMLTQWTIKDGLKASLYVAGAVVWVLLFFETITGGLGEFGTPLRTGVINLFVAIYVLYFFLATFLQLSSSSLRRSLTSASMLAGSFGLLGYLIM